MESFRSKSGLECASIAWSTTSSGRQSPPDGTVGCITRSTDKNKWKWYYVLSLRSESRKYELWWLCCWEGGGGRGENRGSLLDLVGITLGKREVGSWKWCDLISEDNEINEWINFDVEAFEVDFVAFNVEAGDRPPGCVCFRQIFIRCEHYLRESTRPESSWTVFVSANAYHPWTSEFSIPEFVSDAFFLKQNCPLFRHFSPKCEFLS